MTHPVPADETEEQWRHAAWRYVLAAATLALRYRWVIITPVVLTVAISLKSTWGRPASYTANARFMTQGRGTQTSNIATQLGINAGNSASDPAQNPDFYSELVKSRSVLEQTARAVYPAEALGRATDMTLETYHGSIDNAVDALRGSVNPSIAPRTGIISLAVTAGHPLLAKRIAEELLKAMDDFNRQRRQSRAAAERRFTEGRLGEADTGLQRAEQALTDFYTRNRGFDRSPELRFQEQRLTREVARRQQLYALLSQSYEQAKIDEVRDTPVITVFEDPREPRRPDARNRTARVANAALLALFASIVLVMVLEAFRGWRPGLTPELQEFRDARTAALGDMKNPLRAIQRLWS